MATKKYLDNNGLLYFWQKIKDFLQQTYQQRELKTGSSTEYKVLSDNNLTDALVKKINNAGDSSFSGNYDDLTNKPLINNVALSGGNNSLTTLGIQPAGNYATVTQLNNKVDKQEGYGLSQNDFTDTLLSKLNGIAAGAEVNVINKINVNGSAAQVSNKTVNLTIPENTSDLTNDSNFVSQSDMSSAIQSAVADKVTNTQMTSAIQTATQDMATQTWVNSQIANLNKKQIVTSTEEMTDPNTIYLIANSGSGNNSYDEYILVNTGTTGEPVYKPEKIGTTDVDLTNYVQNSDLIAITNQEIDEIFADL